MEKPDRDYTHAKRAEDEYRQLIQQFPDSKLVPEAKARLLQVQEVLAEREYRIGHFYLMRESYPAAIARLRSLVDAYPLYSQADDALLALGQAYEGEINMIRSQRMVEAQKANVINELTNKAAEAYSKIITRYPAMDRVEEAKSRLTALNRPVPTPTAEAIAQNKAEAASRGTTGMMGTLMLNFKKRPDMAAATKVGEPTMEDPKQTNAPEVLKDVIKSASKDIDGKATVETVKDGSGSKESDPVPRSDAGDKPKSADQNSTSTSSTSGTNGETAAPPPNQINDAATDSSSSKTSSATADDNKTDDKNANESTSKPKKKKGFKKLIPF
jgi:outer membrane protein assembly factor BamD